MTSHLAIPVLGNTANDKYQPIGDPFVGYPQLCIRTDRTAERTNLGKVINLANAVADQYPVNDKKNRAKAVMEALTTAFGSGAFGHTWIIFFNSNKAGDYTTYGYHEGYGFVKNGAAGSDTDDSPEYKFHLQRCVLLTDPNKQPEQLEKKVIPLLNLRSYLTAMVMGMGVKDPSRGAYTPVNNCSWFAGNLWNSATGEQLVYEQPFDGSAYADYWGMDFLHLITKIADPGVVAESLDAQ